MNFRPTAVVLDTSAPAADIPYEHASDLFYDVLCRYKGSSREDTKGKRCTGVRTPESGLFCLDFGVGDKNVLISGEVEGWILT